MATQSPMALSHLKVRHLMLMTHLAEFGTLHKAAKHLSISQPAASSMLSDLESLVGVILFNRSHRGVVPTRQGEAIIDCAKALLNEFDDFTTTLERVAQGRERMLRLGVVPQAFATYLPQAIKDFRSAGGCAVRAEEGTAQQLLRLLLSGLIDGVIGRLPNDGLPEGHDLSSLSFVSLYDEEICVVRGASGKEARIKRMTYEDLLRFEWVLQRRDSSVRRAFSEALLRRGLQPPEPIVETTNYVQSLAIVARSSYCTVAPFRAAEVQQRAGAVTILDLKLDIAPMRVSFITRLASSQDKLLLLFRECFVRQIGDAGHRVAELRHSRTGRRHATAGNKKPTA